MILVEDGYSFNDLVNFAYKEIKLVVENYNYDLIEDIADNTNWSEICSWCGFPDLQISESIYERAINTAIFHLMVDYKIDPTIIQKYIQDNIYGCWSSNPITKKYESYSNGDDMCMFINDTQVNIPKDYYDAIKRGDL